MDDESLELLRRVAVGELSPDDEAVQARCRQSPEFAERLRDERSLIQVLGAEGHEEREVLAEGAEADPATRALEDLVSEVALRELGGPGEGEPAPEDAPPPRWTTWHRLALVAAGLLAVLFLWPRPDEPPLDVPMGQDAMVSMDPTGDAESVEVFRWEHELPAGGWYALTIRFEDGTVFETTERLLQSEWTPDSELLSRLAGGFSWEFTAYGPTGSPAGRGGPVRVSPSSP